MEKREFSAEYKTKLVLEVLEGNRLSNEIASREGINPKVLSLWKQEFLRNAHRAFTSSKDEKKAAKALREAEDAEKELMAKVGVLTMENDWLKKKSKEVFGYEPQIKHGFKK